MGAGQQPDEAQDQSGDPAVLPLVWLEVGDVGRFIRAEHLVSYAGLVSVSAEIRCI
jgi:hypothetical protein